METVTHRDIAEWHGKQFIDRNGEEIGNWLEADRLARVRINLPGEVVELSRHERDVLLEELCFVRGLKSVRERFEGVGATWPVELNDEQRLSLRAVLTGWESDIALPDGIARLLAALERADPGSVVASRVG